MKIIKSDKRHQFYNQGMRIILEFNTFYNDQRSHYWRIRDLLESQYGSDSSFDYVNRRWDHSNEWRSAIKSGQRRCRRIFLKDETMLSYILLVSPVNT